MEPINQALRAGNEDGYVLLKDGKLYKWYPKIRQTWVCLGFCSSWRVEDVWLYTQDHLARLWLMLTRHQRHCVNPNVNDRLFLGAGLKYVFIMCHSLFGEMFRKWSNLTNSYFSNGWFVENHHPPTWSKNHPAAIQEGQNAKLGLSKFKMPQSSWEFPSQFPISKVVVETTNSSKTAGPPLSHTHLPPWKNSPRIHEKPTNLFTLYLAPPRSSKEEIPARPVAAVHPLSSLSGAEELKVAPPRFRTGCRRKWRRCVSNSDFFLSFQMFLAKHNRFGNFSNKCLLIFFKKVWHSIVG